MAGYSIFPWKSGKPAAATPAVPPGTRELPTLDTARPAATETAAFALG